jgi:uncharacterized protein YggE
MHKRISLALVVIFAAAATAARAQTLRVDKANRTIEVTASASAHAIADTAILHLGYTVFGPTSKEAYAKASETSNAIADALQKAGVPKDHIQSISQSVNETQSYENQNLTPAEKAARKYRAEQTWTVRLPAKDAAKILNLAVEAGANNSGNIDWQLANPDALEAEAAAKALAHDKQIAAAMAKGLGVTLGPLLYASNQAQQRVVYPMMAGLQMAKAANVAVKPLAINPQRISQSASIRAIFAIQ